MNVFDRDKVVLGLLVSVLFVAQSAIVLAQDAASLPTPVITSITRSRDGSIDMRGKAQPKNTVTVEISLANEGSTFTDSTTAHEDGTWNLTIDDRAFPAGAYMVRIFAQDEQGARSAFAETRGYKIKPDPIISAGGLSFGWIDIFLILVFFVLAIAGFAGWRYERERRRREVYASITERDFNNMCSLLSGDVDRISTLLRDAHGIEPHVASEVGYLIEGERKTLDKMQGYLASSIQKIR